MSMWFDTYDGGYSYSLREKAINNLGGGHVLNIHTTVQYSDSAGLYAHFDDVQHWTYNANGDLKVFHPAAPWVVACLRDTISS